MTDRFDQKGEFKRELAELNEQMDELFRRRNDLPDNTHARHIALNIAGGTSNLLEAAAIAKNPSGLASARESLSVLKLWFELLDTYPEFRQRELASIDGSFGDYNFQAGGAVGYVHYAAEKLRSKV